MFVHEYLWYPTYGYYFATFVIFTVIRRKYQLNHVTGIPFLMVPLTLDYLKRDHFVKLHKKEHAEFIKT